MTYAMYDTTASKSNPGYGFANSKKAIAFSTTEAMDAFLAARAAYDYSSKRIIRREAMTMLESVYGGLDKGLPLDTIDDYGRWVIMRSSVYGRYPVGKIV